MPFWHFIIPFWCTTYAASGWGYLISTVVPPKHGPFIASLVMFIVCGLLGNPTTLQNFLTGGPMEFGVDIVSITRWSVQMSFIAADKALKPVPEGFKDKAMYGMYQSVYEKHGWGWGIGGEWEGAIALMAMGTVLRWGSFLGLRFTNRDKQV